MPTRSVKCPYRHRCSPARPCYHYPCCHRRPPNPSGGVSGVWTSPGRGWRERSPRPATPPAPASPSTGPAVGAVHPAVAAANCRFPPLCRTPPPGEGGAGRRRWTGQRRWRGCERCRRRCSTQLSARAGDSKRRPVYRV
jgi:hypothetical protein